MGVTLDGQDLFGQYGTEIEVEGVHRESIERAVGGLDGVLSVDLGWRERKIIQKGILRAKSQQEMDKKIIAILGIVDGETHALVTTEGIRYEDVRADSFKTEGREVSASGICCDYKVVYTQLKV